MSNFKLLIPSRSAAVLAALVCFTPVSQATIIYDAEASSIFKLISAGGLSISAEITPDMSGSSAAGTGVASIDKDDQTDPALFTAEPLLQDSAVSGLAGATFGTSEASSLNSYWINVVNSTDGTRTAEFLFTYSWSISLTQGPASDAPFEAGFASAFFHLDGFAPSGSETLAIDEGMGGGIVAVPEWLVHPMISFEFDDLITPADLSGTTSVSVYVTAPAMSTNRFSVITDAFGGAVQVPEPGSILLLLAGLWLMVYRSASRKHVK